MPLHYTIALATLWGTVCHHIALVLAQGDYELAYRHHSLSSSYPMNPSHLSRNPEDSMPTKILLLPLRMTCFQPFSGTVCRHFLGILVLGATAPASHSDHS